LNNSSRDKKNQIVLMRPHFYRWKRYRESKLTDFRQQNSRYCLVCVLFRIFGSRVLTPF